MGYDLVEAMTQIAREKNLEFDVVVDTLGAGLLAAAKKKYPDAENISFSFSKKTGEITMLALKTVVEKVTNPVTEISLAEAKELDSSAVVGDDMEIFIDYEEFGRNAIQSAKQVLIQRVREAERERIYSEYISRVGKLVTGAVQQVDKGGYIVNLGNAEAFLPMRELIPRESYRQGDRVRAIIMNVEKVTRGPQITLSRVSEEFLRALFELEVPEVYERVIDIKAIAREPGERAKIAVSSIDDRIDPIGACVGIKGVRVQAIVRELNNERIDIVLYTSNPELFVSRALAPAKVSATEIFEETKTMTVSVEDDKLSLAIGRGGQNARLASKLTGWKINLLPESQYSSLKRRQAEMLAPIGRMEGVGPKMEERLVAEGIASVQQLAECKLEMLVEIEGIGQKTAESLIARAKEMVKKIEEESLEQFRQAQGLTGEGAEAGVEENAEAATEAEIKTD